jgi:hypothetical protein
MVEAALIKAEVDGTPGANDMPGRLVFSTTADGASSPTERFRINNAGSFSAVIPSGSTLYPSFWCRAWVNFNGTGTIAIRASGNVSSLTDVGVGEYKVNLTTSMPDADYAALLTMQPTVSNNGSDTFVDNASTASIVSLIHYEDGTRRDSNLVSVAIFR